MISDPEHKERLNSNQLDCVRSRSDEVFVTAQAGSGKTRVLVERYVRSLVEEGIPSERIVAITYTEKAARELQERIQDRMRACGPGKITESLQDFGNITTIHGYCLKILREYAVEAGLDPMFTVLDPDVARLIKEEVLRSTLAETFRVKDPGLLKMYSIPQITESILSFYDQWKTSIGHPQPAERSSCQPRPLHKRLVEAVRALGMEGKHPMPEWGWLSEFNPDSEKSVTACTHTLLTLTALSRKCGNLRQKNLKDATLQLRETILELERMIADQLSPVYTCEFMELIHQFDKAFKARKRSRNWVDFDDLVQMSASLLEDERVQRRLTSEIDVLLVDEFQDVNPLQARFMERLSFHTSLFTVGDVRQSIYGFRYADCREFLKRLHEKKRGRKVFCLSDNFRSESHLVSFVNHLFESEIAAEPMAFGSMNPQVVSREKKPRPIEIIALDKACFKGETAAALRRKEYDYLADRILDLVESKELNPPTSRPVPFGDIAILLPVMTGIEALETALRKRTIPYHVVRGKGFYYKIEITDMISVLSAIHKPNDDLSLMALVKSPLVGLSDDALVQICRGTSAESFYERITAQEGGSELDADMKEVLRSFLRWFGFLVKEKHRLSLSDMVDHVLESTAYESTVLGSPDGKRRYLNLIKFREKVALYDQVAVGRLDGFLSFIRKLTVQELEEGEASLELTKSNAVKVLTVHAAKGLEFPVVCVAGLGESRRAGRIRGDFLGGDRLRMTCRLPHPAGGSLKGNLFVQTVEDSQRRDREEYKRLFYVALTRAKHHMVLSGISKKDPSHESWLGWLTDRLPETNQEGLYSHGCFEVRVVRPKASLAPSTPAVRQQGSDCPIRDKMNRWAEMDLTAEPIPDTVLSRLTPLKKTYHETVHISVTELVERRERALRDETPRPVDFDSSREYGMIFHDILQHADFMKNPVKEMDRLIRAYAGQAPLVLQNSLRSSLQMFLTHPGTKEFWKCIHSKNSLYRELPFVFRVKDAREELGFLSGQIDLLFRTKESGWILWDYKTGAAIRPAHIKQMMIYAYCLEDLLGEPLQEAVLYSSRQAIFHPVPLDSIRSSDFGKWITDEFRARRLERLDDDPSSIEPIPQSLMARGVC